MIVQWLDGPIASLGVRYLSVDLHFAVEVDHQHIFVGECLSKSSIGYITEVRGGTTNICSSLLTANVCRLLSRRQSL